MAIGAALLPLALGAQSMEKPNVILIMTDQQTAGAMSCAGNPYLRTPAMDALASDGIMFTGAYSPFPLSGPCRASLLTGCYPSVIGALGNGAPYDQEYMDSGIGHRMSDAVYECLFAGKFHAPERNVPESSGFTKICNFVSDPEIVPNVDRTDNCIGDLIASLKSHGLYDLSSDKGEMHNLIADPEYASRLRDCRYRMLDWARRLGNWPCRTRIEPIVKYTYETSNDPVTILSTDLSVDLDPDDWVDAYLFLKSDWMRPQGIILADYAGREEFALARELEELAGRTDVPLLAGVNQNYAPGRKIRNTEGAEFILKTLREQRVKTRLIAVGSLRNEALAYEMDPDLFMRKVEEVVFVSVPTHGEKATNVNRDTSAVRVIFDSGVPILAVPAVRQKLTGEMEKSISESQSPVARFMTARFADWRKRRNKDFPGFLERTGQLEGQGKNLWSLPAFIPETKWCCYGIKAVRCSASYSSETLTVFPPDSRGNDFIMTEWDEKALLEYAVRMISD